MACNPATPSACGARSVTGSLSSAFTARICCLRQGDGGWKGNGGVTPPLFPKVSLYARNTVAVTVGPPVMYRFVLMQLLGKGIPEANIWLSLERRMKGGAGKW